MLEQNVTGVQKDRIDRDGVNLTKRAVCTRCPTKSLVRVVMAAIGLTILTASPVLAQTKVVESPNAYSYDFGSLPSVAMSGTSIVEVHRGDANAFGLLWYRGGTIQPDGIVNWTNSFQYDQGSRPSVAVSGINVVEVHEGTADGFGPLWFRTGKIQADGTVAWNASSQYDIGARPSVAMSGNNVLEVHKGSANGFGLLWYKTGKLQTNGTVVWSDNGHEYDKGGAPRIAASGSNIIEVHQGSENTFGPLWYKTGQFQPNGDVVWSATAYYYDSGASPAVSLAGATILEVHIGSGNTVGPLWVREAEFQADGTVTWNSGFAYDTGAAPSIASAGALALEVHQDRAGLSTELYRTFRY